MWKFYFQYDGKACIRIRMENSADMSHWIPLFCDFFMTFLSLKVTDEKIRIQSWIRSRTQAVSQKYEPEDPGPY